MSEYREQFKEIQRETYWSMPRIFGALVIGMILLYGLGFMATGGDLAIYRFWAPKRANAEREVFVNTNSYIQGKVSHLTQLRLDYEQADGAQKATLRTVILTEAAQVDNSKLPSDLAGFIAGLKGKYESF
jgi:hypothetical protein